MGFLNKAKHYIYTSSQKHSTSMSRNVLIPTLWKNYSQKLTFL